MRNACPIPTALITTPPGPEELDSARQFIAAYKKAYSGAVPTFIAVYAYDAVSVIANAYKATGKLDNDAAAKWLHGLTKSNAIQGATGKLFWSAEGTIAEFFFSTYRVHDGEFQFAKDLVLKR